MQTPDLIKKIEAILGQSIKQPELVNQALIHRSYLNETGEKNLSSNERLEFLGDSVLQMWISQTIYTMFPLLDEGKLTAIRTYLVRTETLALLSLGLSLGEYLHLSRGEDKDNGRHSQLLLANCFEALSAAIFISNGLEAIDSFYNHLYQPLLTNMVDPESLKDSKSLLQEKVQINKQPPPKYTVIDSIGPDHHKTFTVAVYINDKLSGEGKGTSKQEAEEQAAKNALVNLGITR